jgi:hypothetical protein
VWFGTGANVQCTTSGNFLGFEGGLIIDDAADVPYMVCEFENSEMYATNPLLNPGEGDWRPPKIYEYDLATDTLIDRTPPDPLIDRCAGIRSAGSHNGVVFMAGALLDGGIVMWAFDADTKDYLGSQFFSGYQTIRKWLVVKGQLYTGVAQIGQGLILRWTGSRSNPFSFQVVGRVSGFPRELAEYIDGSGRSRIVAHATGIWVSPAIRWRGLSRWHSRRWSQVWSSAEYEPDATTQMTYGGGDLHYHDGWVYWGTLHIPFWAFFMHQSCPLSTCFGEPETPEEFQALALGTSRATSVWRARNLEGTPEIQLLYGEAQLPAYNPATETFEMVPNLGGYAPLWGPSGFGNPFNAYTWTMAVADGRLYIGTYDSVYTSFDPDETPPPGLEFGADLYSIASSAGPAVPVDISGLGNPWNSGIRTLIPSEDGTSLFAGMANNFNVIGQGWSLLLLENLSAP